MKHNTIFTSGPPRIVSQLPLADYAATAQCDACSPVILSRNERSPAASLDTQYHHNPILFKHAVDSAHYAVLSATANAFSVLNTSAITCLQYFQTPRTLAGIPALWSETWGHSTVQSALTRMIECGLLVSKTWQTDVCNPVEIPNTLAAWLHITDRCNLGCTYCYVPHKDEEMSLETGQAAMKATFRSAVAHNYRQVKFKYAGGEPLLRFPFVAELHCYAGRLAEQYGLELDGVVLSNGTLLTRTMLKEMQRLKLRLMVSLDHLSHSQKEIQRRYPDGRDASLKVMQAIELALECGLTPDISITVSGTNIENLPNLLAWVLERNLPFSLNFYRPHRNWKLETGNWGLNNRDLKLETDKMIAGMLEAYKVIEAHLPRRSLLASLADLANFAVPHLRRCSVGHSYLVFDSHGNVSKCQMQMDKSVTDIHAEDPLATVRADKHGIHNISVENKDGCRQCQWRYWCAGGCPLETYRVTGRYDIKSPNCSIYKALYPEVLRLEGLRLLKYAGFS